MRAPPTLQLNISKRYNAERRFWTRRLQPNRLLQITFRNISVGYDSHLIKYLERRVETAPTTRSTSDSDRSVLSVISDCSLVSLRNSWIPSNPVHPRSSSTYLHYCKAWQLNTLTLWDVPVPNLLTSVKWTLCWPVNVVLKELTKIMFFLHLYKLIKS